MSLPLDISRCVNSQCPLSDECLRATDPTRDKRLSYTVFYPDERGVCEFQIKPKATAEELDPKQQKP